MSMSDYLEAKLLSHVLRASFYTPPDTVYVALFTAGPSDSSSGTEVTGGSYARQAVTFAAPSSGSSASSSSVTFTNMPAASIVGAALMDAATGGNVLFWVATTRTTTAGENLYLAVGGVTAALD